MLLSMLPLVLLRLLLPLVLLLLLLVQPRLLVHYMHHLLDCN
jgi:hypothetical protein